MESIHRRVVNCNSHAKVLSSIQRTAIQQSQISFLNGEASTWDEPIIPWSTSHINAKFQKWLMREMTFWLPRRLQEVLFHHGSFSCQIVSHDSVSVTVSRFTSLNEDFVLCCYQFSPIFAARGMASLVRLLHRVQVVLALLQFTISIFQEVSVNSFLVTPFFMAIQALTGFPRACSSSCDWVCKLVSLCLFTHILSHFELLLDT